MNKDRRKRLENVVDRLAGIEEKWGDGNALEGVIEDLQDAMDEIECCMDEEQECLDNLPEAFQYSQRADDYWRCGFL